MPQEVIDWLMVSSMVFFNILCLISIIATIAITMAILRMKDKAVETMDLAQETTLQVGKTIEEKSTSLLSEIVMFVFGLFVPWRQESGLEKMIKNLRRR